MKAHKVLIFIISVMASLALLCSFYPEDGIDVGMFSLRFPSIAEVLSPDDSEDEALSPEELMALRMEAMKKAEDDRFMDYFRNDPARFYCPDDDYRVLDKLFSDFESASEKPVRIVHYGDSQIEVDRVTSTIRDFLQKRFGGMGSGMQQIREELYTYSVFVKATSDPRRILSYGPEEMRGESSSYGPMAQSVHLDTTITVSFSPLKSNTGPSRYFNHATVLCGNIEGTLYLSAGKSKVQLQDSGKPLERVRFDLPDSSTRFSVTMSGNADIFGIQLDGDKGISMDNVPMRGCSGTIFTRLDRNQLKDYYSEDGVRLIILQYGGNTVPYLNKDKSISDYRTGMERQIRYLRKIAPEATVIFIGPSDMATKIDGKMQTYQRLPDIVDSLKAAANNCGAVFWDMYGAMGGHNSMTKWVEANPPLAGSDYVHFTPKGAQMMGEMFSKSLMLYYDYFKLRREEDSAGDALSDSNSTDVTEKQE